MKYLFALLFLPSYAGALVLPPVCQDSVKMGVVAISSAQVAANEVGALNATTDTHYISDQRSICIDNNAAGSLTIYLSSSSTKNTSAAFPIKTGTSPCFNWGANVKMWAFLAPGVAKSTTSVIVCK